MARQKANVLKNYF
ncbi:hypothetical protein CGLO_14359 [Colletotrichum gloeosporioides Cg-14]|uniref:Uncharacterized protein n=1 Tax=Colletotrichum gloeosporioides (strain Cg-14) TaxID=1237896 RepID=T0K443_COLGC|nr:hypothetical protein CGLO_14359 [Colletotrichum gloeosporioides Cg-14]